MAQYCNLSLQSWHLDYEGYSETWIQRQRLFLVVSKCAREKKIKQQATSPNHKLAHQIDIFVSMVSVVSMVMETLMDMWKVITCAANSSPGLCGEAFVVSA